MSSFPPKIPAPEILIDSDDVVGEGPGGQDENQEYAGDDEGVVDIRHHPAPPTAVHK